ncbi:MAG: PP2C family protein-serine/threonine phosphatase [Candidatus Xenobiia bacterium LiM19]
MNDATHLTIMVVDDTETNIDILVEFLGDEHDIQVAMDGMSALEQIAQDAPDLILLDIMMPGMSGIEVLERLKKDQSLQHIPVIMISAVDEMKTVVRCIELGAEDYLPKPFDPVLLNARIGASLEKKRFRDAEQEYLRTIVETQKMLQNELSQAAEYVISLLPEPQSGTVATAWRFIPSIELGGDSFGYYWLDDDHFVIFLLDVCGHGVGAALLSISIMNIIRSGSLPATDFHDPGAVLAALNERFQMEKQHDMYFTIWYGVYNNKTRQIVFGSGGHPPSILISSLSESEHSFRNLSSQGSPIGWDTDSIYTVDTCRCEVGSRLYIFSDGVYEFRKPDGSMMAYKEFTELISSMQKDGDLTIRRIVDSVCAIQGSESFEDDFSLIEVTFN